MADRPSPKPKSTSPGFVVFRKVGADTWQLLGEVPLKRGLPARAARPEAILEASGRTAKSRSYRATSFSKAR